MKKIHLLAGVLILFFLFGCAEKTFVADKQTAQEVRVNELIETDTETAPPSQENEIKEDVSCIFDSECPENKFCMARSCTTIEEFYSQNFGCCEQGVTVTINDIDYSDCGFMATLTENMRDCTQIPCTACTIGSQRCVAHPKRLENLPFYNYCAECLSDSQCKTGYSCINNKCV